MSNERRQPSARRDEARGPSAGDIDVLESKLLALPELEAPPGLWQGVRDRLDQEPNRSAQSSRWGRMPVALAASVVLLVLVAAMAGLELTTGESNDAARTVAANVNPGEAVAQPVDESPQDPASVIASLMEQSRLAEEHRRAVLAFYSPSGPEQLLRATIGDIDAALNDQLLHDDVDARSREELLRDRVDLMADLTDIERFRQHEFVRQVSF